MRERVKVDPVSLASGVVITALGALVLLDSVDAIVKEFPDYTIVPGHGDSAKASDFAAFRDYLATLRKLVADGQAQGKSGASLVEAVTPALADKYGQWDYFKYLVERNILETDAELSGKKTIPQAQR